MITAFASSFVNEAPQLEIGRAHGGPDSVDDCGLGMEHCIAPFVEPDTRVEEALIAAVCGFPHDCVVRVLGKDDPYVDLPRWAASMRACIIWLSGTK